MDTDGEEAELTERAGFGGGRPSRESSNTEQRAPPPPPLPPPAAGFCCPPPKPRGVQAVEDVDGGGGSGSF